MAVYLWESACIKAVLETDNAVMPSRIAAARSAILERLDDVANGVDPISEEEIAELKNALMKLNVLEQERCAR